MDDRTIELLDDVIGFYNARALDTTFSNDPIIRESGDRMRRTAEELEEKLALLGFIRPER